MDEYIKFINHELRQNINNIKLSFDNLLITVNEEKIDDINNCYLIINKSIKNIDLLFKDINYDVITSYDIYFELEPLNIIGLFERIKFKINNNKEKNKIIFDIDKDIEPWIISDNINLEKSIFLMLNIIKNLHLTYSIISKFSVKIKVFLDKNFTNSTSQCIIIRIIDKYFWKNYIINNTIILDEDLVRKFNIVKKIITFLNGDLDYNHIQNICTIKLNVDICMLNITKNKIVLSNSNSSIISLLNISLHDKKFKILLVDDCKVSRKLLNNYLSSISDILINELEDGLQLINNINDNNHYGIIILDNLMPNITGTFAIKLLRSIGYKGFVLGLTGNNSDDEIELFMNNGLNYIMIKPFDKEKLTLIINFIINTDINNFSNIKIKIVNNEVIIK
jgi:CheY-like chemotaxis protein